MSAETLDRVRPSGGGEAALPGGREAAALRPFKLTVAALGGQGGAVLCDWLVSIAEAQGYLAQSTSVPGVAQRTGATIYYLEFFPRAAAEAAGREPIMALMPVPGDVDCVAASELAEAGRAIQRGLVTPERTTLLCSTHRSYAISEKSAMGRGIADSEALLELAREHAKRLIAFDMDAVATRNGSVISAALLGAFAGSGVLAFPKSAFEAAIKASGIAVDTNLAAFEDAYRSAQREGAGPAQVKPAASAEADTEIPERAASPSLQPLLERVRRAPESLRGLLLTGVRRSIDFQDPNYADLFLERIERIIAVDRQQGDGSLSLAQATARALALWMSFEDTIRVADLKTRAARFSRVRAEVGVNGAQVLGITDFVKPRVVEIAGTMPARWGRWLLDSPRVRRRVERFTEGRQLRTSTIGGFLMLYALAGAKRWRRRTLRYVEENARIEQWLAEIERLGPRNYALAVELAKAQRLIKGYGDTHERGLRNFELLTSRLKALEMRPDGAERFARLHAAALADEDGRALGEELKRA